MAGVLSYWYRMSGSQKNLAIFYIVGAACHSSITAYREAVRSLAFYREQKHKEVQTEYNSEFDAFWGGFRRALFYRLIDSAIWPIKLVSLGIFLVHRGEI
jgi:hypothetical protein